MRKSNIFSILRFIGLIAIIVSIIISITTKTYRAFLITALAGSVFTFIITIISRIFEIKTMIDIAKTQDPETYSVKGKIKTLKAYFKNQKEQHKSNWAILTLILQFIYFLIILACAVLAMIFNQQNNTQLARTFLCVVLGLLFALVLFLLAQQLIGMKRPKNCTKQVQATVLHCTEGSSIIVGDRVVKTIYKLKLKVEGTEYITYSKTPQYESSTITVYITNNGRRVYTLDSDTQNISFDKIIKHLPKIIYFLILATAIVLVFVFANINMNIPTYICLAIAGILLLGIFIYKKISSKKPKNCTRQIEATVLQCEQGATINFGNKVLTKYKVTLKIGDKEYTTNSKNQLLEGSQIMVYITDDNKKVFIE